MEQPKTPPLPPGWGDDGLSAFLETARGNQLATFNNKRSKYTLLQDIDDCFAKIAQNLDNPKNLLSAGLLYRSHSAYRAACGTAMAGFSPETFVLLRSCLEYAGYGLLIFRTPSLGEVWLRRHEDSKTLAATRNQFTAGAVERTVAATDAGLGRVYSHLYQASVDFGAHPNERGVTSSMTKQKTEAEERYLFVYLHQNGLAVDHALLFARQVGLCSLLIFQNVFPERFMLLGLRDKLIELRKGGL